MQLAKMRPWKLFGLVGLIVVLAVPFVIVWQGTSQPDPVPQPEMVLNLQDDESAAMNPDEPFEIALSQDMFDLADEDEMDEFTLMLNQQPMMPGASAEQKKLMQQNRLLLLISRLGLTKEQLQQFKAITADLIKSRDEHRAALEKHQKDVNDFLLKFQGTDEDLQKGLQELKKTGQELHKAHHDKVAAAEKTFKQNLNWEQGEKLTKAVRVGQRLMVFRRGLMGPHGDPGPRAFNFRQPGEQKENQHMMPGERSQGKQRPMMRQPVQPGQRLPHMAQGRQAQGPQVGPIGHFLMKNVEILDEVLAAKLAALGS
jgi:hypothetical protein